MMYVFALAMIFSGLALPLTFAQDPINASPPKLRFVTGQVLTSTELPAVRLRFDKAFKYVGSQEFILYGVARAEQHFFVDADKQGRVRRMYWVQFEGYLPDNTHSYKYESKKIVTLGGLEFIADAYARNIKDTPPRADSDGSKAHAFLLSKGYQMKSKELLSQRLVHLVDAKKRNELMIIYLEDMTPLGVTTSDLAEGGRAADRWEEIARKLLERASKGLKVTR
jgi:hypothetical protein